MRNRAKCKLCLSIIESYHRYDYVSCKCGEISISGGNDAFEVSAKDYDNFLRVDDFGHEIVVRVSGEDIAQATKEKPMKKELLDLLDNMISGIENMPSEAMATPITHYDFCSALILIASILKSENQSQITDI